MYYTYILESLKIKKFYIGSCNNLDLRLKRHNLGLVRSTKINRPYKIVYYERYLTRKEAYYRERKIKSYKGGCAFKNLIKISCGTEAAKRGSL